jgi:hypothetical protein
MACQLSNEGRYNTARWRSLWALGPAGRCTVCLGCRQVGWKEPENRPKESATHAICW